MQNSKDNKLENYIFKCISNNQQLNSEIIKIYDVIFSENISASDKTKLCKKVLGEKLINEDREIAEYINQSENLENESLLYKLSYQLSKKIFNIEDSDHTSFILSNSKEEIETDLIYFLRDVFELIGKRLHEFLSDKKSFFEQLKNDYLSDDEYNELESEIETFFHNLTLAIFESSETKKIENKIQEYSEKRRRLLDIN